jgi:CRP-like cAMP-binding protein
VDDDIAKLRQVQLFESLSDEDLAEVAGAAKVMEFPSGAQVTKEGSTGVGFHLILDGRVSVTVGGVERATLGPGRYFGEMSLLDNEPRSATVTALSDLRTFSLASWDFMGLISSDFDIARKIFAALSRRIRELEEADPSV